MQTLELSRQSKIALDRGFLCLAAATVAIVLAAPTAHGANATLSFEAQVGIEPGPVLLRQTELKVPATRGLTTRHYEVNRAAPAPPLRTAASIGLDGTVRWAPDGEKTLGVKAVTEGYVTAFDPMNPPPPMLGVIEATVTANVDAVVTVRDPDSPAGTKITFNLLDPRLHGSLMTPLTDAAGSGLASIHGTFILFEILGLDLFLDPILGEGRAKTFEFIADTETDPVRDFSEGGGPVLVQLQRVGEPPQPPVGDANPDFEVLNGGRYLAVVEFYARASVLPIPTQSGAASQQIDSASTFESTLYWGGFGGFANENGLALPAVQLLDEEGVDWAVASTPVPLPPAVVLQAGAMVCLGGLHRRRKQVRARAM